MVPVRISWTCQVPGNGGLSQWQVGFGIAPSAGGSGGQGQGVWCDANNLSGTFTFSADGSISSSWDVHMEDAADAAGPWTATVEIYN